MKATRIKKLVEFIKAKRWYIMFFWPAINYRDNPNEVRAKLNTKLIQIADYCRKHSLKFCVILPERDLYFYASMFRAAGAFTIAVVKKEQTPALTDYEYIIPPNFKLKLSSILPNCSSVLQLRNPDDDYDDESRRVDDSSSGNISKSILIDITPLQDSDAPIYDGNPSVILNKKLKQMPILILQNDPYAGIPDMYSSLLVQRIPDGNVYIKAVEENMPLHAVPRVQLMGGGSSFTSYPLRGITP